MSKKNRGRGCKWRPRPGPPPQDRIWKPPEVKQARAVRTKNLEVARILEPEIQARALAQGMTLQANVCQSGRTGSFLHWIFREADTGFHVLHFWPSRGTWWSPQEGEKGKCDEPLEALELATFRLRRFRQEGILDQARAHLESIAHGAH